MSRMIRYTDMRAVLRRWEKKCGHKFGIDIAYGTPRIEITKGGFKNPTPLSPRLPARRLADWMAGFEEGMDLTRSDGFWDLMSGIDKAHRP